MITLRTMTDIPVTERERRDRLVAQAVAEGLPAHAAIVAAGYSESNTRSAAIRIVERALKNSPLAAALAERVGDIPTKLATVLAEGLDACRPTVTRTKGGETTTIEGGADHAVRHKFLETAVRVTGMEPEKETEAGVETHEQRILRLRGLLK